MDPSFYQHSLLVASGKGGVGKSTLSTLMALSLARRGWKINLLDADLTGPSLPTIFGLERLSPPMDRVTKKIKPFYKYGVHLLSYGHFLAEAEPVSMRGPLLSAALHKLISSALWPPCDLLIVDMPPTTGDISLGCIQMLEPLSVVLVGQNNRLSLCDARRAANHYHALATSIVGLYSSMERDSISHGKTSLLDEMCQSLEIDLLGSIPYSPLVMEALCHGRPQELLHLPWSEPLEESFHLLAKKLLQKEPLLDANP